MSKLTATRKAISNAVDAALDMSRDARLQRAREQGFDTSTVYYHGTTRDFDAFDPARAGTVTATPAAFPRGMYFSPDPEVAGRYVSGEGGNIIPVFLRKGGVIDPSDTGRFPNSLEAFRAFNAGEGDTVLSRQVAVARDPANIRSVNAAFDPAKSDSPNLLAGGAAAAVGLGAATQGEDAEAGIASKATKELSYRLSKMFPGVDFSVSVSPDAVRINKVVVPEDARNQGIGSALVSEVNRYADDAGLPVALTADGDFGGSKAAQQRFYKRLGFSPNKGGSRDFSFTENMLRPARSERGSATPEALAAAALAGGVTEYARRREERRGQWQALRDDLLGAVDQAVQAIEMPWRGYLGLTRTAGGLMAGESFSEAMMQGAQQARQPVEQTAYDLGGRVTDATGSPLLGTAVNLGVNLGGPI